LRKYPGKLLPRTVAKVTFCSYTTAESENLTTRNVSIQTSAVSLGDGTDRPIVIA